MNPFAAVEVQEMKKTLPDEIDKRTKAFERFKNEMKSSPQVLATINQEMAGKYHPESGVLYKKHIFVLNGQAVEGVFPKFDSIVDIKMPKELYKATDTEQFKYCTKQLAKKIENSPELAQNFTSRQIEQIRNGEPRISGLTWHHNELPGKMQLVDAQTHGLTRHTGGRSLWGGGSDNR